MVTKDLKKLLQKLNEHTTRALEAAAGFCIARSHYEITVEHLLLKLLEDGTGDIPHILNRYDIDGSRLWETLLRQLEGQRSGNTGRPSFSPKLLQLVEEAWIIGSVHHEHPKIRSGHILQAMIDNESFRFDEIMEALAPIRRDDLRDSFIDVVGGSAEDKPVLRAGGPPSTGAPRTGGETALDLYTLNVTAKARDGKIDPVFARDKEIRQIIDILSRRRKNNPILVGEAGVGKSAVVEGLALRVAEGDVPDSLKEIEIHTLDLGLLQAGAGVKGEFENRLKSVIQEVREAARPTILFIDEAHTLIGAGGAAGTSDAANLLKPALARGELRTIAATTWSEYKKYIEKDPALERRFQLVKIEEPSVEDAAVMLRGIKVKYEEHHRVQITNEAVYAAAKLSERYVAGRQLPDKAVDLMDTALARVKMTKSAKPSILDDVERRLLNLSIESKASRHDLDTGLSHDEEAFDALAEAARQLEVEKAELEERWRKERALTTQIEDLRRRIVLARTGAASMGDGEIGAAPMGDGDMGGDGASHAKDAGGVGPSKAGAAEGVSEPGSASSGMDSAGPGSAGSNAPSLDADAEAIPDMAEEGGPAGAGDAGAGASVQELRDELRRVQGDLSALQDGDAMVHAEVNEEVVAQVIADWTGIPVGDMLKDEAAVLLDLEGRLTRVIKGQDEPIEEIADSIRAAKAGMGNPDAPLAVFLLVGPSGVGKTETARMLAEMLFGGDRFLITINMSEYQESHTVSQLKGSPPGYVGYGEGGVLTEAVRQRPYSVVLLDETEKAHIDVMELFYQVFDKGIMRDGEGREIDFRNTIIMMTSNIGSEIFLDVCTDDERPTPDQLREVIHHQLVNHFQAALLARMKVVPYYPLQTDAMREITRLKLNKIDRRLQAAHGMRFEYSDEVAERIAERCTQVDSGARNIDFIIDRALLPEASKALLVKMTEEEMPEKLILGIDEQGDFTFSFDAGSTIIRDTV